MGVMIHGTRGDLTLVHVGILDTCTRGDLTLVHVWMWTRLHVEICTRGTRGGHTSTRGCHTGIRGGSLMIVWQAAGATVVHRD